MRYLRVSSESHECTHDPVVAVRRCRAAAGRTTATAVCIVNGEPYEGDAFREIPPAEIESMEQLPADEQTVARYGDDASNGVIIITLKYDTKASFDGGGRTFDRYVAERIRWDATDPVARVVYRFRVLRDGRVELTDLLESTDGGCATRWSGPWRRLRGGRLRPKTANRSRRSMCCACSCPRGGPCRPSGR